MSPTVIVGGGPAGLTAAWELAKLGLPAVVLEKDPVVGGIARTVNYKGYRFDLGGHRFFTKVELIRRIWEEILGDDLLERPRLSRIYHQNHFFDYPLRPLNALAGLGPVGAQVDQFLFLGLGLSRLRLRWRLSTAADLHPVRARCHSVLIDLASAANAVTRSAPWRSCTCRPAWPESPRRRAGPSLP